jgi:hypothetical protein
LLNNSKVDLFRKTEVSENFPMRFCHRRERLGSTPNAMRKSVNIKPRSWRGSVTGWKEGKNRGEGSF